LHACLRGSGSHPLALLTKPTDEEFRAIFSQVCADQRVVLRPSAIDYLFRRWYEPQKRALRGCHPRDLVEAIVDSTQYGDGSTPAVTTQSLDEVCHTYFLAG
jgi:hypothetical protein